ncbi:MAG TPA: hypothetical protein VFE79_04915 [Paraburkholderia sp.]|nr:hypothetical protein [Paraburkholderia sp.]
MRLNSRFTRCPACGARQAESLEARPARAAHLKVPLSHTPLIHTPSVLAPQLPARKIWRPTSRALTAPYYATVEASEAAPAPRGLRRPVTLGVSALVVTSALYLGFLQGNETTVSTPMAVSGKVKAQPAAPPTVLAQRAPPGRSPASVRTPLIAKAAPLAAAPQVPPVAPVAPTRHVSTASTQAKHNPGEPVGTQVQTDKARADASRQLRSARANLQQNNLSATRARVTAAIAAQPDNRDALNLRDTLGAREQRRDALLSLARGCSYVARWACVWHNAGSALAVDSSSKEAQRLVDLATRETELASAWPAQQAAPPAPDDHTSAISHH